YGNWDFNGNHVYGQIADSVDMYADVHVGRASVYSVALAQNFLNKVFTYEKNPPTGYLKKMLLPTAILWSSYNERPMQDSIARMTPAGWVDAKLYEREGTLSRQRMIDSMNVGYGMGHWVGHGNENGIYMGSSAFLNSTDANNLINGDRQGIANSIACMCGGWDLTPGSDCFAERLVNRVGGGLVAAIMNSRYGWGAYVSGIGYVPGPSERIDTTFYYNLLYADMWRLGVAHAAAKDAWVYYADSGYQYDMTRWCIYELNLFGDPEMPVWTDVPQNLTVSYPALVPLGAQNVNVVVTSSGIPVGNALVCLQKGEETYASDYTNASGLVTLSVEPTSPGAMHLTVTALNHYPFEDSVIVQASQYAYVTFLRYVISDPAPGGNDNGQLNAGESIELPVWVKNWGQSQGTGITGALSTANAYAALSDTLKGFGNIAANDSAYTGADGFNVAISPSCPDQTTILFTLTCRDNVDSTWSSQFSISVHAPDLVYWQYSVAGGNNILEPGETADVVLTLMNEGSAAAGNVNATLVSSSSLITINDNGGSFGMILPDSTGSNSADPFNVTASSSAAYGTMVSCDLIIEADFYTDTIGFELAIGEPVPSDTGHYYVYYSGGLHSYAPVFDWFGIAPPGPGTIVAEITDEDADTVTVSIPFTFRYYGVDYNTVGLCSNGFLELGSSTHRFGSNTGIPSTGGPRAMVAAFWADLNPALAGDIYQYHDAANHRWLVEFNDVAHYGAVNDRETFQVILLDPAYYPTPTGDGEILVQYLNGMAQSGATFGIENQAEDVGIQYYYNGAYHEWAAVVTDSFTLRYTTYRPDYVGVEEYGHASGVPLRTLLTWVSPNPFVRDIRVSYQLAAQGWVSLRVYDALGRTLCGLADGMGEPGYYTVTWHGRDEQGSRVPAGVYFIRLETDDYQSVQKIVLLR
ncbi:T9SS type A sorting domain-containing protein, partial [candidate division WOR-3 bacterium]|nr:T9SS type A sorting domain-containing protein [candidate division WOR-3 bacterium]